MTDCRETARGGGVRGVCLGRQSYGSPMGRFWGLQLALFQVVTFSLPQLLCSGGSEGYGGQGQCGKKPRQFPEWRKSCRDS